MSITIDIWNNLLKQGVDPKHVLQQACDHEGRLDALPQSEERDQEIKTVVAFIKDLFKKVYRETKIK